jgi:non-homologous end joining protein Ku
VKPYRSWKGALELEFKTDDGVVPMSISIELYARVKKARNESFRTLAPSGQPRETQSIDPATGEVYDDANSQKGVKIGTNEYVPMTDNAIEQINAGTQTTVLKPEAFCPLDTIALDLAIDRFYVRPQADVAGADQSLNIVWNGLLETGLAWCTQMSIRGGHDAVLVLYADQVGLFAALLPFADEVYPAPAHVFDHNPKAGKLFASMVGREHDVDDFDHSAWESEYRARRQAAIDAVIEGRDVPAQPSPTPQKASVPDLMAALEASAKKAIDDKATAPKPAPKKKKVAA